MSLPTRATCAAGRFDHRGSARRNDLAITVAAGVGILFPLLVLLGLVEQLLLGALLVFMNGRCQAASRQGGQELLNLLERLVIGQSRPQVPGPLLHAPEFIVT